MGPTGHGLTSQGAWEHEAMQNIANAAAVEASTAVIRDKGVFQIQQAYNATIQSTDAVVTALESAVQDKVAVASTLQCTMEALYNELDLTSDERKGVERSISSLTLTLEALKRCDKLREQRPQKEKVRDGLAYALNQYDKAIQESSLLLKDLLVKFEAEERRLTQLNRRVAADLKAKGEAIRIDQTCLRESTATESDGGFDLKERLKSHKMKYSWEENATGLMQEVQNTVTNAARLRIKAQALLQEKIGQQASALQMAREALEIKVAATGTLKAGAEYEVARIQQELDLATQEHGSLQQAINDKAAPLQVAENRLRTRDMRPRHEKIRDRAEEALEREVEMLTRAAEELTATLQKVTKNIYQLEEKRKVLEGNAVEKAAALRVDEQCLALIHQANEQHNAIHGPSRY